MNVLVNFTYDELNVGDTATYTKTLTEEQIILFAAASGDLNPVHLDPKFAETTIFKERIAHGMWSGALISAAIATVLPGPGSIYLEQSMAFHKPVKIQDTLTVTITVVEKLPKSRVMLDCEIHNQNDEKVVTGIAKVIAPKEKCSLDAAELPEIAIG